MNDLSIQDACLASSNILFCSPVRPIKVLVLVFFQALRMET
jgi:hypothetical protein